MVVKIPSYVTALWGKGARVPVRWTPSLPQPNGLAEHLCLKGPAELYQVPVSTVLLSREFHQVRARALKAMTLVEDSQISFRPGTTYLFSNPGSII